MSKVVVRIQALPEIRETPGFEFEIMRIIAGRVSGALQIHPDKVKIKWSQEIPLHASVEVTVDFSTTEEEEYKLSLAQTIRELIERLRLSLNNFRWIPGFELYKIVVVHTTVFTSK